MKKKILISGIIITVIFLIATTIFLIFTKSKGFYHENFENGKANGFVLDNGDWKVVDDGTGNKVLSGQDGWISFGPELEDFSIEFRMKSVKGNESSAAGLKFRNNPYDMYEALMGVSNFGFYYVKTTGSWNWTYIDGADSILQNDKWYSIKVIAQGDQIQGFVDGMLAFSDQDSNLIKGNFGFSASNSTFLFDDIKINKIKN